MKKSQLKILIRETIREVLKEVDYKKLRKDAPNYLNTRVKSKQTPGSIYQGITDNGYIKFITKSHTDASKKYTQLIKLNDLPALIKTYKDTKTAQDIVRLAIKGDIEISCSCPAWSYFFHYKATKDGYAITPENRPAKIKNPKNLGSVCKHADNSLLVLPFSANKIVADLKKLNLL